MIAIDALKKLYWREHFAMGELTLNRRDEYCWYYTTEYDGDEIVVRVSRWHIEPLFKHGRVPVSDSGENVMVYLDNRKMIEEMLNEAKDIVKYCWTKLDEINGTGTQSED